MHFFKKKDKFTFPLNLLGDNNLVEVLRKDSSPSYAFPVGKNSSDDYVFTDLEEYAHIIAAGQTGSGMAVFQDTMLVSLMYKNSPEQLKLISIDPKQVSLSPYKNSPYLQLPWLTQPHECESAIEWLLNEMERRFAVLTKAGVRDFVEYNSKYKVKMHAILLVIDELADLMVMNGEYYEKAFVRLMQKSRAVGIMSFMATHRASDEILPGIVRANSFVKLAFTLPTKEASELIIDQPGAETLRGRGDLLLSSLASNAHSAIRLQAPYISDDNLMSVLNYCQYNINK